MHTIVICMGSSCFCRGNRSNLQAVQAFLSEHDLTESVRLKGSRCEGLCLHGPNLSVDGVGYHGVTPETVDTVLRDALLGEEGTP